MSRFMLFVSSIVILLFPSIIIAQDESPFKTVQLTANIYQLITDEGAYTTNVLLFVGDDGVLLVDSNTEQNAEELKKVVESFGKGIPRYIINTHRHVEHIGGNAIFGEEPIVIAHDLLRTKLKSGSYIFDEFSKATYPDISMTDSLFLYFNGEKIRLVFIGGSHDDNEILVHFTNSKIVHISSIVNGLNFPSIDSDGDVFKFPEVVKRVMSLVPKDVILVSGHNNNCTYQDLQPYYEMLVQTKEIVKNGLDAGKDIKTLQDEKVLKDFENYNQSYVSPEEWIESIAQGFDKKEPKKKDVFPPIYYAIKEGGADKGVETYLDITKNHPDGYDINDFTLLVIGNKLYKKEKNDQAVRFLELSLEENPESSLGYYTNYILSKIYKGFENKEKALKYCQQSIELNSEFQAASDLLEEIKKLQ